MHCPPGSCHPTVPSGHLCACPRAATSLPQAQLLMGGFSDLPPELYDQVPSSSRDLTPVAPFSPRELAGPPGLVCPLGPVVCGCGTRAPPSLGGHIDWASEPAEPVRVLLPKEFLTGGGGGTSLHWGGRLRSSSKGARLVRGQYSGKREQRQDLPRAQSLWFQVPRLHG